VDEKPAIRKGETELPEKSGIEQVRNRAAEPESKLLKTPFLGMFRLSSFC